VAITLSGVVPEESDSSSHAADLVAVHDSVAPSTVATRNVIALLPVEPTCAKVSIVDGLTVSRSAAAGLINLSRRHVVTDMPSANTRAIGPANRRWSAVVCMMCIAKSRLIGDLQYKVNGLSGRAPAHVVAVAQQAVCLGSAEAINFAEQLKTVRGELRPIAATLNKSLKSRDPGVRIGDGAIFFDG